jgi:DNA-binding transcriptional LysR family regulator
METNRLRQFRLIVETGNLRKAADLLGISHSGLSKSMRALEMETGFALFLPSGRGIVVSDAGRALYEKSHAFLSELDRLLGRVAPSGPAQVVRWGSFEVFTSYFAGELLKHYLADHEVEIHELAPGRLEEALLLDKVDFGVTYEPMPRPGIEYTRVTRIEMGAFALHGRFRGQPLSSIPFVIPAKPLEGAPSGVRGSDAWPSGDEFKRMSVFRVDLMTTGIELVRQGLCAIFIPKFIARLHNRASSAEFKLSALPLPSSFGSVKRDVYIVRRESTAESDAIKKTAKALRRVCADPTTESPKH